MLGRLGRSGWDYDFTGGNSSGGLSKLKDKRVGIIGISERDRLRGSELLTISFPLCQGTGATAVEFIRFGLGF